MAKDAKFDNWVSMFTFKNTWRLNVDLPVLTPWRTTSPINTPNWVLERNPYYYAVDTEGNQLPYIDKIQMTLAENLEVLNLRAIAGEYDWQERHTGLGKLPVFLENQQKGNYTVKLDPAANGSECVYYLNQSYDADPEIAKWLRNRDVRRALSIAIDRDQLNETFWLGVGIAGLGRADPETIYSPGEEWRKKWATLDVDAGERAAGQGRPDPEGRRGLPPAHRRQGPRSASRSPPSAARSSRPPRSRRWSASTGRRSASRPTSWSWSAASPRSAIAANELQIGVFGNDGSDFMFATPSYVLPVLLTPLASMIGPLFANWYVSNGEQGVKPEDPELLRGMELFRAASSQETAERIKTGKEIWKILAEECLRHRHRRALAGRARGARGQEQRWGTCRRGRSTPTTAGPPARSTPRRCSSRAERALPPPAPRRGQGLRRRPPPCAREGAAPAYRTRPSSAALTGLVLRSVCIIRSLTMMPVSVTLAACLNRSL